MFDQRELDKRREWRFNARDIVRSAAAAQQSEPFDTALFIAILRTIEPWGLAASHARMLYNAIKAVK